MSTGSNSEARKRQTVQEQPMADWFVEDDSFGNPTLWHPNPQWPDYPIALLVRVPSNAALFDGIVGVLDQREGGRR